MRSPFKFLDAYSLKDKDAFFGRKEETDLFYEMVNKNRLLLVYGQSGSGKTSLVECGLANRFDVTDWYPIRVRRRQNINVSLRESLQAILIEDDEDNYDLPETLTEQIEDIYAEYLRPVYLIFDQLEEIFILGDEAEQEQFIQSIADLYHSKIACRVIFILREEYLGHLYDFEKVIPTLFDRRLRVEVMNNTKVQTVLEKSFAKFNISLETPAQDRLQEMIANISGGKALIQLPYLQVYLDMLYREDYQRTYGEQARGNDLPPLEFTQAEIAEFGEIEEVLSKFLDFQEKEIQRILSVRHPNLLDHTVLQIMDAFVTDEGTKRPLAYTRQEEIVTVDEKTRRLFPPVADDVLSDCFWELETARIIRGSDNYMELAHDSLAALITEKRGDEQKVRKRLASTLQEYELTAGKQLLTETQLMGMSEILPRLYLDDKTKLFIQQSKEAIKENKIEAHKKQQQKLQLIQDKLKIENRARKRQNVLSMLLGVALTGAIALGLLAYQNLIQLRKANKKGIELSLKEADSHIMELNYKAALEKTILAVDLAADPTVGQKHFQEIAFFYLESGYLPKVDSVLQLMDIYALDKQKTNYREKIKTISPSHYEVLENRYFPEMILIPSGEFIMGNNKSVHPEQKPAHKVRVDSFWMAKSETTVWQFFLFSQAKKRKFPKKPSWGWEGNNPIVNISWYETLDYMNWLSEIKDNNKVYSYNIKDPKKREAIFLSLNLDTITDWQANGYRLPTEGEWEYAANDQRNQGLSFKYAGSNDYETVAWFYQNANYHPNPVATKLANGFGLYDMSGNVWEWVWDSYHVDYYKEFENVTAINPKGPPSNGRRVLKGSGWYNYPTDYIFRGDEDAKKTNNGFGFRCAKNR